MKEIIENNKFVELRYQVIDKKTASVLTEVEFPLDYVHGANQVLSPQVTAALAGKTVGDVIEFPIDCNRLYGPRDESLVFTDSIENVPEEYRELGTTILTENAKGETKEFIVTKIDKEAKTLTVDGNNPLCGREVIFRLEILNIRDATAEEVEAGGKVDDGPDISEILKNSDFTAARPVRW